ncbi:hypothetical protein J7T55_004461 [Diaporthe amygdali]|uniref:uncharacterized protein n=1 Tax=Phomopsis amygdali TaxID=1214568 RepID=UPI0022FE04CE|nr:uncharacterized protein J7T55_004461 [Diaporthe amygdali]KAJ0109911.1 hypothetical protein J7T55_004461 [Diaporthe amygdali]
MPTSRSTPALVRTASQTLIVDSSGHDTHQHLDYYGLFGNNNQQQCQYTGTEAGAFEQSTDGREELLVQIPN